MQKTLQRIFLREYKNIVALAFLPHSHMKQAIVARQSRPKNFAVALMLISRRRSITDRSTAFVWRTRFETNGMASRQ